MSLMPYYKCYQSDYLTGCLQLTCEEKGMYRTLIDLMYDRGVPLPYDTVWIGRVAGCSTRRAGILIERLIAHDKVQRTEDGNLTNRRVEAELRSRGKIADKPEISAGKTTDKPEINRPEECENKDLPEPLYQKLESIVKEEEEDSSPAESHLAASRLDQSEDCERVIAAWNEMAKESGLPTIRMVTGSRKARLQARLKSSGIDAVLEAIGNIKLSPFCLGQNSSGWRASFDFVLQEKSFVKLIEGAYGRSTSASLPLLRSINGGRQSDEPAPVTDPWCVNDWCRSLPGAKATDGAGKWGYGGRFIDVTAKYVAEAARLPRTLRVDFTPLIGWVDAGIKTDDIIAAIKDMAAYFASNSGLPKSLAPYNTRVMERRAA